MELLEEAKNGECVQGCNGEWLICEEVLHNNGVPVVVFRDAVTDLLVKG